MELKVKLIQSQTFRDILSLFISWRIALILVTYFGLSLIPHFAENGRYITNDLAHVNYWLKWANWDGGHYRGIAENGYLLSQTVFFPLYPLLIKTLLTIHINSLVGGLIISNVATLIALWFLYRLVHIDSNRDTAKQTIFLLLIFPTAFYLGSVYAEGLFLALATGAFYFARKERWIYAALFAGLAAITRQIGLVVIVAIIGEYLYQDYFPLRLQDFWRSSFTRISVALFSFAIFFHYLQQLFRYNYLLFGLINEVQSDLFLITIPLLGGIIIYFLLKRLPLDRVKIYTFPLIIFLSLIPIVLYIVFLKMHFGDPLAFLHQEINWNKQFTMPWTAIRMHFQMFVQPGIHLGQNMQGFMEFTVFVIFFIGLIISYFTQRFSYFLYYLGGLLMPLSSGTLESIHRYGLVLFPFFIVLAHIHNEFFRNIWVITSLTLLGILSVMFINAYWVS